MKKVVAWSMVTLISIHGAYANSIYNYGTKITSDTAVKNKIVSDSFYILDTGLPNDGFIKFGLDLKELATTGMAPSALLFRDCQMRSHFLKTFGQRQTNYIKMLSKLNDTPAEIGSSDFGLSYKSSDQIRSINSGVSVRVGGNFLKVFGVSVPLIPHVNTNILQRVSLANWRNVIHSYRGDSVAQKVYKATKDSVELLKAIKHIALDADSWFDALGLTKESLDKLAVGAKGFYDVYDNYKELGEHAEGLTSLYEGLSSNYGTIDSFSDNLNFEISIPIPSSIGTFSLGIGALHSQTLDKQYDRLSAYKEFLFHNYGNAEAVNLSKLTYYTNNHDLNLLVKEMNGIHPQSAQINYLANNILFFRTPKWGGSIGPISAYLWGQLDGSIGGGHSIEDRVAHVRSANYYQSLEGEMNTQNFLTVGMGARVGAKVSFPFYTWKKIYTLFERNKRFDGEMNSLDKIYIREAKCTDKSSNPFASKFYFNEQPNSCSLQAMKVVSFDPVNGGASKAHMLLPIEGHIVAYESNGLFSDFISQERQADGEIKLMRRSIRNYGLSRGDRMLAPAAESELENLPVSSLLSYSQDLIVIQENRRGHSLVTNFRHHSSRVLAKRQFAFRVTAFGIIGGNNYLAAGSKLYSINDKLNPKSMKLLYVAPQGETILAIKDSDSFVHSDFILGTTRGVKVLVKKPQRRTKALDLHPAHPELRPVDIGRGRVNPGDLALVVPYKALSLKKLSRFAITDLYLKHGILMTLSRRGELQLGILQRDTRQRDHITIEKLRVVDHDVMKFKILRRRKETVFQVVKEVANNKPYKNYLVDTYNYFMRKLPPNGAELIVKSLIKGSDDLNYNNIVHFIGIFSGGSQPTQMLIDNLVEQNDLLKCSQEASLKDDMKAMKVSTVGDKDRGMPNILDLHVDQWKKMGQKFYDTLQDDYQLCITDGKYNRRLVSFDEFMQMVNGERTCSSTEVCNLVHQLQNAMSEQNAQGVDTVLDEHLFLCSTRSTGKAPIPADSLDSYYKHRNNFYLWTPDLSIEPVDVYNPTRFAIKVVDEHNQFVATVAATRYSAEPAPGAASEEAKYIFDFTSLDLAKDKNFTLTLLIDGEEVQSTLFHTKQPSISMFIENSSLFRNANGDFSAQVVSRLLLRKSLQLDVESFYAGRNPEQAGIKHVYIDFDYQEQNGFRGREMDLSTYDQNVPRDAQGNPYYFLFRTGLKESSSDVIYHFRDRKIYTIAMKVIYFDRKLDREVTYTTYSSVDFRHLAN